MSFPPFLRSHKPFINRIQNKRKTVLSCNNIETMDAEKGPIGAIVVTECSPVFVPAIFASG